MAELMALGINLQMVPPMVLLKEPKKESSGLRSENWMDQLKEEKIL